MFWDSYSLFSEPTFCSSFQKNFTLDQKFQKPTIMPFGKTKLAKTKNPFIHNMDKKDVQNLLASSKSEPKVEAVSQNPFETNKNDAFKVEATIDLTMDDDDSMNVDKNAAKEPIINTFDSSLTTQDNAMKTASDIDQKSDSSKRSKNDRKNPKKTFTTEQYEFSEAPFAIKSVKK